MRTRYLVLEKPRGWNSPLTCSDGAEDGIRTRDPHLGKVFEFVHGVLVTPPSWPPVYGRSTESARIRPCCRAVYYEVGPVSGTVVCRLVRPFPAAYWGTFVNSRDRRSRGC